MFLDDLARGAQGFPCSQCYRLEEVIAFDMHPETRRKAKIPAKVKKVSVQIARDEGQDRSNRSVVKTDGRHGATFLYFLVLS